MLESSFGLGFFLKRPKIESREWIVYFRILVIIIFSSDIAVVGKILWSSSFSFSIGILSRLFSKMFCMVLKL